MGPLRILRSEQLPHCLDLPAILASQANVFVQISAKTVTMPHRTIFPTAHWGTSFVMPAYIPASDSTAIAASDHSASQSAFPSQSPDSSDSGSLGLKFIGMRPSNRQLGLAAIQGCVVVADEATARISGLVDAAALTAWRTAAEHLITFDRGDSSDTDTGLLSSCKRLLSRSTHPPFPSLHPRSGSALATLLLSPPTSCNLLIFGSGAQAHAHAFYMLHVRPTLRRVTVVSPNPVTAPALLEALLVKYPELETAHLRDPDEEVLERAVRDADIICTCTSVSNPLFPGHWPKPSAHINAVGSYQLHTRELDAHCVSRCALVVVDAEEDSRVEAGDLVGADWEGHVVEVGSLYTVERDGDGGDHVGADGFTTTFGVSKVDDARGWQMRKRNEAVGKDVTLFKSVGVAAQDIAIAAAVLNVARVKNIGTVVDF
ncbi:hypothetical protein HDU93_001575 [Gonapodya sp. JEL0774]|nr:hypothetical protein HDU93_001575 [Gonapodya sp. JEL0774]